MSKVVLSKSGMQKERENLRLYEKVLPSLDLKRRQLMGEQKKAEEALRVIESQFGDFTERVAEELPMLGAGGLNLKEIVRVKEVVTEVENVVGVKVPALKEVAFEEREYSILGTPHWIDTAVMRLREFAQLKARHDIAEQRVAMLSRAARKITQRVNLFEKILIPRAKENIKKIQIYLADAERASVVQSKIAKAKGRAAREALRS